MIIDNWADQAVKEVSGPISLTAGTEYAIVMEYYENLEDAIAELRWSSPSVPKQIVPQSQLFSTSPPDLTPTPTLTPTPDPLLTPTPEPIVTPTPESTPSPESTPTLEPTPTPISVPTPSIDPTPTPSSTSIPTAEPTPTPSSGQESIATSIQLERGWNLISFTHLPGDNGIETVLQSLQNQYVEVVLVGQENLIYRSDQPASANTLHTIEPYYSYWIYVENNAALPIQGDPLDTTKAIELVEGWNSISYPLEVSMSIESALVSINGLYDEVRGFDTVALSYVVDLPPDMNTLTTLEPGHGYIIKMKQPATLTYPAPSQGGN